MAGLGVVAEGAGSPEEGRDGAAAGTYTRLSALTPSPVMSPTSRRTPAPFALLLLAAVLSACASSGPVAPDLDERLFGVWTDEGGAVTTIAPGADGYAIGVVDTDDEVFDVVSTTFADGVLTWTYHVPSTGYRVTHRTTAIAQDLVELAWDNSAGGSGTDTLTRVE